MSALVRRARRALVLAWLPGLAYVAFAVVRGSGHNPGTDLVGVSAVLRIAFLAFGISVAYLVTLLAAGPVFSGRIRRGFWYAAVAWLTWLFIDDSFLVHERLGGVLGISDTWIIAAWGAPLMPFVLLHRERFSPAAWAGLAGFALLGAVGVFGDSGGEEGVIDVAGFPFDYEQFAETLAILCLAAATCAQAVHELLRAVEQHTAASLAPEGLRHKPGPLGPVVPPPDVLRRAG